MAAKNKNRSGFLFMFIIIILLLIIGYAYRDKFQLFFKSSINIPTNFLTFAFEKNKDDNKKGRDNNIIERIRLIENKNKKESIEDKREINNLTTQKNMPESKKIEDKKEIEKNKIVINKKQEKIQKDIQTDKGEKTNDIVKNENVKNENKELKKRISKIYFTALDNNDNLILKSVNREIFYYNTPLTETLKSLFNGLTNTEIKENYITNIPKGSKILKAWIKDGILYLDVSSEFENNNYGRESTVNQLKQIVWTATEFPNVDMVKFLVNGKEVNYLGGEGVFIGKPLGRSDF